MDIKIEIRPIQTHDEYWAVEKLQRETWNMDDVEIVPDHLLITAHKNGGVLWGAFESTSERDALAKDASGKDRLVGFVFGFVGLTPDGKVKHCSHMAGVSPHCQNKNVGYRLKLAQRECVLAQGMDLVTWTFDLLESRNARLNFHKLGATCSTYLRNLYGHMRDGLNVGLPSDRFQVEWHITSAHVADRLRDGWVGNSLSALLTEGIPILNRVLPRDDGLVRPLSQVLPVEGDRLLIQIPARFQVIKSTDLGLALAWREHTRALFETAFAKGYTVVDLLFSSGQSYYLLEKDWVSR